MAEGERDRLAERLQDNLWFLAAEFEGSTTANTEEFADRLAATRLLSRYSTVLALVVLGASLLLLVLAGMGMTRTVLRPLEQFRSQVEAFAAGDRTGRPEPAGVAEIAEVGRAFDDMADQLGLSEKALTRQAFTDDLTGLPNRAHFLARLEQLVETTVASNGEALGHVLFVDLDNFKHVNDSLGHPSGDELLKHASGRLKQALRAGDVAARLGGDEFGILLPGTDLTTAEAITARVHAALSEPAVIGATAVTVSASVGIATIEPGSGSGSLLRDADADAAMYVAKAAGRNRHQLFSPEMHAAAVARMQTESELRRAVEHDELVLHYQPIVRLLDDGPYQVCSVEALVRWQHPQRGLLKPSAFLEVAVDTGLIEPIGVQLLHRACMDLAFFRQAAPQLTLSINLSARELHNPGLVDLVRQALLDAGLTGEALVVELTENDAVIDVSLAAVQLASLRSLGVRVALDDFGTGYSSLSYLQQLPIDALKIDRSFIPQITSNQKDFNLVDAILAMARALGLETVAEGIQDSEVQRTLTTMGCAYGQGYSICHPLPRTDLLDWLKTATTQPNTTGAFLPLGLSR